MQAVRRAIVFMPMMLLGAVGSVCGSVSNARSAEGAALSPDILKERAEFKIENNKKIQVVAAKLLKQVPLAGGTTHTVSFPILTADIDAGTKSLYSINLDEGAVVAAVLNPKHVDQLQVGDVLVRFDGISIKSAKHLNELISDTPSMKSILMKVNRKGSVIDLRLDLDTENVFVPFAVAEKGAELSSEIENGVVKISAPMLSYLESDDELAFIMAHEIGHTVLKHERTTVRDTNADMTAAMASTVVTGIFKAALNQPDLAAAPVSYTYMPGPYVKADEVAADEYALQLMKRAGYDPAMGYAFLSKYEGEIAKIKNDYSHTYSQVHPVGIDRLALIKDALDNKTVDKMAEKYAIKWSGSKPDQPNTPLGAVDDPAIKQNEFKLRGAQIRHVRGSYTIDPAVYFFFDDMGEIAWYGHIEETYQWFEVGSFRVELYAPDGKIADKCDSSYMVIEGINEATCNFSLDKIKKIHQSGVWTVKAFRGKDLLDVRKIFIGERNSGPKYLKKRSDHAPQQ